MRGGSTPSPDTTPEVDVARPYETESALRELADRLRATLRDIDGDDEASIKQVARVSVALTGACAELRQHAKGLTRSIGDIPLEMIVEHLKSLEIDRRKSICRDVLGEDDEGPVL